MPWIILIPPDEVGGVMRVAAIGPGDVIIAHHWPPFVFSRRETAEDHARQFRCGIVVEMDEPLRLATSSHESED